MEKHTQCLKIDTSKFVNKACYSSCRYPTRWSLGAKGHLPLLHRICNGHLNFGGNTWTLHSNFVAARNFFHFDRCGVVFAHEDCVYQPQRQNYRLSELQEVGGKSQNLLSGRSRTGISGTKWNVSDLLGQTVECEEITMWTYVSSVSYFVITPYFDTYDISLALTM